jgi:NAD-reducing hydrogenase large subunit
MEALLADKAILDTHVRAHAGVNALEGVGIAEAPRGVLIHHYKVDEKGAIRWVNLIVATGHNNLAMNRSVRQVCEHFIDGKRLQEGMLNRVSAVVRAYDPCLSCSTHAAGLPDMHIRLLGADGRVLDELESGSESVR